GVEYYSVEDLIAKASKQIEDTPGSVDAIVSYYDFPGTTLVPILAEKFGVPSPSLKSILKCEHKYWSRLEQQKVIPNCVPHFFAFDPFDDEAYKKIDIVPPYWIKPIKSFRSFLAYKIHDEYQFNEVMKEVRENIDYMTEPFHYLFEAYHMPAEFTYMKELCIAESPLTGHQCTVEGYVFDGEVVVYGIVDSIRERDRSSFARYEYPSSLPQEIQFRMADVSRRAVAQIGLDNSPFNIEFFYNPTYNQVMLLEINPRISQAHTDIFEKVHGIAHHHIMLNIALGHRPATMELNGDFKVAANFMLRTYESGRVMRVPSPEDVEAVTKKIPGTIVKLQVKEGMHLSELHGQDSYSYELANIFIGGKDQLELLGKYYRCLEELPFEIKRDEETVVY
ncbi:MAG: ATP-grasp domain-containing protein, partial [Aliifodinibius sp.]|nr:ATP-grasp domain-containing protein [Fodinibius sp.]NIV14401.1 ATP-grasp domain-containing protein [Fodinibius sp.]NIY28237.1 ATP-grasp domain-containing protein [Fodinibius sp.]